MIFTDVIDAEEEADNGSIYGYGAASDGENESGSGEAGVRKSITQSGTEEVEEVHQAVKYPSILSYLLKPPYLLTHGFKYNKKAQENPFKNMCNIGSQAVRRNERRDINSYPDVDSRKDQYHMLNPTL